MKKDKKTKHRILLIVSRFNEMITSALLSGAKSHLLKEGYLPEDIQVVWAPGAFELPLIAQEAALSGKYKAIICLGCVIRGETPHFDFVAGQTAAGLMRVSLEQRIPVSFGVLTTDTIEQALSRSGLKHGNKGVEATQAMLESLEALQTVGQNDSNPKP